MTRWTIRTRWIDGNPQWVIHDPSGRRRATFEHDEHPEAIAWTDRRARQGDPPIGFQRTPQEDP